MFHCFDCFTGLQSAVMDKTFADHETASILFLGSRSVSEKYDGGKDLSTQTCPRFSLLYKTHFSLKITKRSGNGSFFRRTRFEQMWSVSRAARQLGHGISNSHGSRVDILICCNLSDNCVRL